MKRLICLIFAFHCNTEVMATDIGISNAQLTQAVKNGTQRRIENPVWTGSQPQVIGGSRLSRYFTKGDNIYVQDSLSLGHTLGVYQVGTTYSDSETQELLGQELILAATAQVIESDSISTLQLQQSFREVKHGFRVLPLTEPTQVPNTLTIHSAKLTEPAEVLAIVSSQRAAGQKEWVYLNKGHEHGVEIGHVFNVYRSNDSVTLSNKQSYSGKLIVINAFSKMSIGMLVDNQQPVRVGDRLLAPITTQPTQSESSL